MSSLLWYVLTVLLVFGAGLFAIRMAIPPYVEHLLDVRVTELPDVEWRTEKLPTLTAAQERELDKLIKAQAAELREMPLEELPPPLELVWGTMQDVGLLFFPQAEDPRWRLSPEQFLDAMLRTSDLLRREAHSLSFSLPLLGEINLGAWVLDQPIERYIQTADWANFLGDLRDQFGTTGKVAGEASKFAFPLLTGGLGSIFTHTIKEAGLLLLKRKVTEQYARLYTHFAREIVVAYSQRSYLQEDEAAALWEAQWLGVMVAHCGVARTEAAMTAVHYLVSSPRNFRSREAAVARLRSSIEAREAPEEVAPARVRGKQLLSCIDAMQGLDSAALLSLQRLTTLLGEPSRMRKTLEERALEQPSFDDARESKLGAALLAEVWKSLPEEGRASWETLESRPSPVSSASAVVEAHAAWEAEVLPLREVPTLDLFADSTLDELGQGGCQELLNGALGCWLWSGANAASLHALRDRLGFLSDRASFERGCVTVAERGLIGGLHVVGEEEPAEVLWGAVSSLWSAVATRRAGTESVGSLLPLIAVVEPPEEARGLTLTRALVLEEGTGSLWFCALQSRTEGAHWRLEGAAGWTPAEQVELLGQEDRWVWRGTEPDSAKQNRFLRSGGVSLHRRTLEAWTSLAKSDLAVFPRPEEVWTAMIGSCLLGKASPSTSRLTRERQKLAEMLRSPVSPPQRLPALSSPHRDSEASSPPPALAKEPLPPESAVDSHSLKLLVLGQDETLVNRVCATLSEGNERIRVPLEGASSLALEIVAGRCVGEEEELSEEIKEADAWLLLVPATPPTWRAEAALLERLRELADAGGTVLLALVDWELLPPVRGWEVQELWPWMPGHAASLSEEAPGGRSGAKLKALWNTWKEARARLLIPAGLEDWPLVLTRESTHENAGESGRTQLEHFAPRFLREAARRQLSRDEMGRESSS